MFLFYTNFPLSLICRIFPSLPFVARTCQNTPVSIPSCLLLLPLYSMSLQKSAVIRGGTDTRVDERAYFQQLLNNMDIEEVRSRCCGDVSVVCSRVGVLVFTLVCLIGMLLPPTLLS
jgi:hypothetical protein